MPALTTPLPPHYPINVWPHTTVCSTSWYLFCICISISCLASRGISVSACGYFLTGVVMHNCYKILLTIFSTRLVHQGDLRRSASNSSTSSCCCWGKFVIRSFVLITSRTPPLLPFFGQRGGRSKRKIRQSPTLLPFFGQSRRRACLGHYLTLLPFFGQS